MKPESADLAQENELRFGKKSSRSFKRRAQFHDYRAPGFYMITLVVAARKPLLGALNLQFRRVRLTPLGLEIFRKETAKISAAHPNVEVWRTCIMPDHIHMIIRVEQPFSSGASLGTVVAGFKSGCNQAYWRHAGILCAEPPAPGLPAQPDASAATAPPGFPPLFEQGYNDRLLFGGKKQLDSWKRYLADNPRRLAIKCEHPELFKKIYNYTILGDQCQLLGNPFLLDIPDKMSIHTHRADSQQKKEHDRRLWMACGERGGVLVSAAISEEERQIIAEALERGYSVIHLISGRFSRFYKPSGAFLDAFAEGRVLEISLANHLARKVRTRREECLAMNAFGDRIAAENLSSRPEAEPPAEPPADPESEP